MISLGGLKYRNVLAENGGPIGSIEEGVFDVFGEAFAQSNARLNVGKGEKGRSFLFSDADGTGISRSSSIARHVAISEALERWAYRESVRSDDSAAFGFNVDPSSNGMAAFPGLSKRQARRIARLEAIERVSLLCWWEGALEGDVRETPWPGVVALSIDSPYGAIVVILWRRVGDGMAAYGHAAGDTYASACARALLELLRHESAVKTWNRHEKQNGPSDIFEKRALFFASGDGHAKFLERLHQRKKLKLNPSDVVCDREIEGPWSRYTTVWRFLFRPPSLEFVGSDERYFFW